MVLNNNKQSPKSPQMGCTFTIPSHGWFIVLTTLPDQWPELFWGHWGLVPFHIVKDAPVKLSASLGLQVRSRELKTGEIQQRDENLRKKNQRTTKWCIFLSRIFKFSVDILRCSLEETTQEYEPVFVWTCFGNGNFSGERKYYLVAFVVGLLSGRHGSSSISCDLFAIE